MDCWFVLSFAKIVSGSELNSLQIFLNRLICYESPPCFGFSGSNTRSDDRPELFLWLDKEPE